MSLADNLVSECHFRRGECRVSRNVLYSTPEEKSLLSLGMMRPTTNRKRVVLRSFHPKKMDLTRESCLQARVVTRRSSTRPATTTPRRTRRRTCPSPATASTPWCAPRPRSRSGAPAWSPAPTSSPSPPGTSSAYGKLARSQNL
jgi:hypothetical protein